jgi:hypothetical protein
MVAHRDIVRRNASGSTANRGPTNYESADQQQFEIVAYSRSHCHGLWGVAPDGNEDVPYKWVQAPKP